MPLKLLDLPRDVLDPCLKELLPPLDPLPISAQGNLLTPTPIPEDLHSLLLVCKTLNNLALPWVWRRLTLSVGSSRRSSPCFHWKQSLAHPERFGHIRLFTLDITFARSEDILAIQSPLKDCISLMSSLQMLVLDAPAIYLYIHEDLRMIVDEIYFALCSRPRLHTLAVISYLPMLLQSLGGTTLKRLIIHNQGGPLLKGFLGVAPSLESLALFGDTISKYTGPGQSHLPWNSLRDISFHSLFDLVSVLQDFKAWKVDFPDICCPLTEIFWEEKVSPAALELLLTVFEGQNIRTFSLRGIPSVDADFISRVARAFPKLQKLSLIAQDDVGYDGEWGAPSSIAESLAQMPLLKSFSSNLLANEFDTGPGEGYYWGVIRLIAERCHALERLNFDSSFDIFIFAYAIERDERGTYVGEVRLEEDGRHENLDSHLFSSSGWRSAKDDDI